MKKVLTLSLFLFSSVLQAQDPRDAQLALLDWFECEECVNAELVRVVKLGSVVVPALARTLNEGPPPTRRALHRRELEAAYSQLQESGANLSRSRSEYLATYQKRLDLQYRQRAARALGRIRTHRALRALRAALNTAPDPFVRSAIEKALKTD